mgnify:CR=1 FL=1
MLSKSLYSTRLLTELIRKLNKKIKIYLFILFLTLFLPLLLLLLNNNIYVLLIDVSSSMSSPIYSMDGRIEDRITALFKAVIKLIDQKKEGKFVIVTYGNHGNYLNAPFTVLDSIVNYSAPENFGGIEIVPLSDKKDVIKKRINDYYNKDFSFDGATFLSEALFKTIYNYKNKNINILIFGDGDDQNHCISEEDNVIEYWKKLKKEFTVHTIGIGADEMGTRNFKILASSGNGKYIDVKYIEDLYRSLIKLTKDEDIIIFYICLNIFLFLVFYIILKRR